MKLGQKLGKVGVAAWVVLGALGSAQANQKFCVYDMLGATGDLYNMTKDYAVAMQPQRRHHRAQGLHRRARGHAEDFRTGQCDAVIGTAFRIRQFNSVAGSIDTLGSTTIVRNGKIDIAASYDVVRKLIQTYASPAATKLMTEGNYEVSGLIPLGAAYPIVNDRSINTIEKLAGKRIAAFDHDKAQAVMIQRIGAQPVSYDITNFSTKFNNGAVDMIAAPTLAYKPLELAKGIGKNGGITRFPIMILTYQMVINRTKFPDGFGVITRVLEQPVRSGHAVDQAGRCRHPACHLDGSERRERLQVHPDAA